jgi:hypothetical protein
MVQAFRVEAFFDAIMAQGRAFSCISPDEADTSHMHTPSAPSACAVVRKTCTQWKLKMMGMGIGDRDGQCGWRRGQHED